MGQEKPLPRGLCLCVLTCGMSGMSVAVEGSVGQVSWPVDQMLWGASVKEAEPVP